MSNTTEGRITVSSAYMRFIRTHDDKKPSRVRIDAGKRTIVGSFTFISALNGEPINIDRIDFISARAANWALEVKLPLETVMVNLDQVVTCQFE